MQLKRTNIIVKFKGTATKARNGWLSNWSAWYNTADLDWIKKIGVVRKDKPKRDVELDRLNLVKIAREMETQLFSEDTLKSFKKQKLKLPFGFTVNNVTKLAVHKHEPEEICISGYGDVTLFEIWLRANEYNYSIRNTY